ncbi:MAG TPA: 3-oxoacyl-[acyl-carrier-protein] synthase III C-terminal domain-containing protein [Kofleriaceae bacterium]|nr:3-oxoacyl-[acyl-carrier-protein] synthase III C-terminal domain-containing protein [Kofleriaceae bacterium]
MGTRIEAAATAHPRTPLSRHGALHLTDEAARECLRRTHHQASELDLLVNTGIYKDFNTAEPALASLIQEDIGANPGSPPKYGHHGTFSFDLVNGGCGVITAAQLLSGFVGTGRAQLALIVAGDSDPSMRTSRGFPFEPAGGAILLGHASGDAGFYAFRSRTFPEYEHLYEATLHWEPSAGLLRRGRNIVEIHASPELGEVASTCAAEVVTELLASASLQPAEIDLVIASQYPHGFGPDLALHLGIPVDRIPLVDRHLARAHTAGPIAALEAAIQSGQFGAAKHTLFVAAGAGLTVAAALYRNG